MPKTEAAKRAQRRWLRKHLEETRAYQEAYRNSERGSGIIERRYAAKRNQYNNDRGWREMRWNEAFRRNLKFSYRGLSLVTRHQAENPEFIFEHRGYRKYENLREPLPV